MTNEEKAKKYRKRKYKHIMSDALKKLIENCYLDGYAEGRKEGSLKWVYLQDEMPEEGKQILLAYKTRRGLAICRATYHPSVKKFRNVDTSIFLLASVKAYAWTELLTPPVFKE